MQILKERVVNIFRLKLDTVLLFSIYFLSFSIPAFFGKPQLLIGSVVNSLITVSVLKYGFKKSIPVFILPSMSALFTGLLFSGATPYIVYLVPFIISSNIILAFILSKQRNLFGVVLGSVLKAVFLFSIVNVLMSLINLPSIFLTSMGYIQGVTAIVGGSVGFLLYNYIIRDSVRD